MVQDRDYPGDVRQVGRQHIVWRGVLCRSILHDSVWFTLKWHIIDLGWGRDVCVDHPMARILIVDDDDLLRSLLQYRLSADGHEVLALEDGSRVLSTVQDNQPDLIVLDAMMPVMDGFEILRRLKSGPSPDSTPVIMLTALKREADIVGALELGAADYLAKPFIPDELSQRIRRILAARSPTEITDARARRPS